MAHLFSDFERLHSDPHGMSTSAVKTCNMAASNKQIEAKQPGHNTMVRYLTKSVEGQTQQQKVVSTHVRRTPKTPKRKQRQPKTKSARGKTSNNPEQTEDETEDNLSCSEIFSESYTGDVNITLKSSFTTLAELDAEIVEEIDLKTINLTAESQPLLFLSLLKKIENLETNQEILLNDNENLKKPLEFGLNKIQDLEDEVTKYKGVVKNAMNKIDNVNANNSKLKEESDKLKEKSVKAETYSRRNNLHFEGIPSDPKETPYDCRNKIYAILKNEMNIVDAERRIVIERCHRDSRYPSHQPPSILVRFLSFVDREKIWQKRDILNRTQRNKLFLNQDFPPEVEKKRSFLRPYVKAAYEKRF